MAGFGIVLFLNGDHRRVDFPGTDAQDHDVFQLANGTVIALEGTNETGVKKYRQLTAAEIASPKYAPLIFSDASAVAESSDDQSADPDPGSSVIGDQ